MTRKRAVKIIMSVTRDGYRNVANDLMKNFRKMAPEWSNEEVCLCILVGIYKSAEKEGDFITMFRVAVAHRALVGKVAMPLPEPPKGETP